MKYFIALLIAGGVYFVCFRSNPVAPAANPIASTEARPAPAAATPTASSPQHTNLLKRPLDRTREVLGQVRQTNGENAF